MPTTIPPAPSPAVSERPSERIRRELLGWPGVVEAPHRFGGVEFRLGRRELGHLHGDRLADLPFPVRVREELVRAGRAVPHHVLPASGWVSLPIRTDDDVAGALALFRLSYERATAAAAAARDRAGTPRTDDVPSNEGVSDG